MNFTGVFNYQRSVFTMTTEARTEREAWSRFCTGLAKRHNVRSGTMRNYFNGEKLNYTIKEAKP